MDSPVRKMQKRNDYNRHKLFRKIRRRRRAQAEQLSRIAEKELKKKLRVTPVKYDDGKISDFVYETDPVQPIYVNKHTGEVAQLNNRIGTIMLPDVEVHGGAARMKDIMSNIPTEKGLENPTIDPFLALATAGKFVGGNALDFIPFDKMLRFGKASPFTRSTTVHASSPKLDLDFYNEIDPRFMQEFDRRAAGRVLQTPASKFQSDPTAEMDVVLLGGDVSNIVDKPIPQSHINVFMNSVLPRLQAMRPGYKGGVLRPTVKSNVDATLKDGYTLYPNEIFDAYSPGAKGMHFPDDGHIAIREGNENAAIGHELRHRLSEQYLPNTAAEKQFLEDAYDEGFKKLPGLYKELGGYNSMGAERVTTNFDARNKLLGLTAQVLTPVRLQNTIIDKIRDDQIFKAVESANGYGRAFIDYLRNRNALTPEKARQFREAMKNVGMYSSPIAVGAYLNQYNDQQSGYKNGKTSSGIHIEPSHRGRLTALKKRTGKSEAELYRTGSAATRKMITFARNARKWNK